MNKVDEFHFLLVCPNDRELRRNFLSPIFAIGRHFVNFVTFLSMTSVISLKIYQNSYILQIKNVLIWDNYCLNILIDIAFLFCKPYIVLVFTVCLVVWLETLDNVLCLIKYLYCIVLYCIVVPTS